MFKQIKGNGTLYRIEKGGVVIDLTNKEFEQLVQEMYEMDRETIESAIGMDLLRAKIDRLEDDVSILEEENTELQNELESYE